MKINGISISLIILGISLIGFSIYFYHDLGVHQARGSNPRYHWFFYGLYKAFGKSVTCIIIAAIGIFMIALGIRKLKSPE